MVADELKPCPFCGGEAKMHGSIMDGYWVGCFGKCFACTQHYLTEAEAIAAWNARAERTCKPIDSERCLPGTDCPAWLCSECGELFERETNFCSNCGAKVVGNGS